MAPPSKSAMEFGPPLGGRNNNVSTVKKYAKLKDFGPPLSMSATDLAPAVYGKIAKKRSSEILGDRYNFYGKWRKKFRGTPKKRSFKNVEQGEPGGENLRS